MIISVYIMTDATGFTTCVEEWKPIPALREAKRRPLVAPIQVYAWKFYGDPKNRWACRWELQQTFTWDGGLKWH